MPGLFDPELDPSMIEGDGVPLDLPQPAEKAGRSKWKELAPLLALLPMALKQGGRVGGAALLRGYEQAKQQSAQQDRQDAQAASLDAYRQAQLSGQHDQRVATAENNELQRRQQFLTQFGSGLEGLDTPEAVQAYMALQGVQGDALGIPRAQLEAMAPAPTALQRKAATKLLDKLRQEHGTKFMEVGPQFTYSLPGDPQPVSFEEVLRRAGQAKDPNYVAPPPEAEDLSKSGLEVQAAAALKRGDRAEYERLKQVKKEMGQADDRPPDPSIAAMRGLQMELAQQRLQQAQTTMPAATVRRIDAKAKGFDTQQVVKETQLRADAATFAEGLDVNTKNPADDIALIYAFAKAMDPNSVVREGEYATVQKYAQSWADSFRFNAQRIFSNTAFLSPEARLNMKKTIRAKYLAGKGQYDAVRKSYADQINKITGGQDGDSYLIDYSAGFPKVQPETTTAPPPRTNPFRR